VDRPVPGHCTMSWAPDPILGGSTRTDGVAYKLTLRAKGDDYTWNWRISWRDSSVEPVWLDDATTEQLASPETIERFIDTRWPEAVPISSVSSGVTTHTVPLLFDDGATSATHPRPRITLTKAQATLLACGATITLPDGTQLNVDWT